MKRARVSKRPYTYKGKTEERWLAQWTDLKGIRREKRFHNKRHAEAYATKIDRELADNVHVADRGTITFKQAAEDYLKWIDDRHNARDRDIAGSTRFGYTFEMRKHIIPHFGHRKLNQIKSTDVQHFINEEAQKYGRGYVSKFYRRIKAVLKHAVNNDLLARNPLDDRPAKIPGKDKRRPDIPGYEEVRKLFAYLSQPRPHAVNRHNWTNYRVMISLGAFAGMRSGECVALKWEHIDWVNNEIKVQASRSRYDGDKQPKSESGRRSIPMNPILRRALEDHHAFWRHRREGHVLRGRDGNGWGGWGLEEGFRSIMSALDLVKPGKKGTPISLFSFHALRHFAVSAWLQTGMRIQDVSRHVGHKQTSTTMDVYAHLLKGDDHSREVISKMAAMFPELPAASVPMRQIEGTAIPMIVDPVAALPLYPA